MIVLRAIAVLILFQEDDNIVFHISKNIAKINNKAVMRICMLSLIKTYLLLLYYTHILLHIVKNAALLDKP